MHLSVCAHQISTGLAVEESSQTLSSCTDHIWWESDVQVLRPSAEIVIQLRCFILKSWWIRIDWQSFRNFLLISLMLVSKPLLDSCNSEIIWVVDTIDPRFPGQLNAFKWLEDGLSIIRVKSRTSTSEHIRAHIYASVVVVTANDWYLENNNCFYIVFLLSFLSFHVADFTPLVLILHWILLFIYCLVL